MKTHRCWYVVLVLTILPGRSSDCFAGAAPSSQWTVKSLTKLDARELRIYSPDGKRFLVNREDAKGVAQVYVGKAGAEEVPVCITDVQQPGGPRADRMKMQVNWHPSGKWIFLAVERDAYDIGLMALLPKAQQRATVEGLLQCGIWTDMWAVSVDGKHWNQLTRFKSGVKGMPDGFTGPAFTRDGKRAVWSQIVDGNVFQYTFGRWELICAEYSEQKGAPVFSNLKDIAPAGMNWNEPGNFSPDGVSLLISGSTQKDATGMDQYVVNIKTGEVENLTNSPGVWDEHGVFSPDGQKIIFMSSYPYRADPNSSKVLSCRTEFMLMNKDGSGLTQLTHFREAGHADAAQNPRGGMAACALWNRDGRSALLTTLIFPKYEVWEIRFKGEE